MSSLRRVVGCWRVRRAVTARGYTKSAIAPTQSAVLPAQIIADNARWVVVSAAIGTSIAGAKNAANTQFKKCPAKSIISVERKGVAARGHERFI